MNYSSDNKIRQSNCSACWIISMWTNKLVQYSTVEYPRNTSAAVFRTNQMVFIPPTTVLFDKTYQLKLIPTLHEIKTTQEAIASQHPVASKMHREKKFCCSVLPENWFLDLQLSDELSCKLTNALTQLTNICFNHFFTAVSQWKQIDKQCMTDSVHNRPF